MRKRVPVIRLLIMCLAVVLTSCVGSPRAPEPGAISRAGERSAESSAEARAGEVDGDLERIQLTGLAPRTGPLSRHSAPGWAGEKLFGHGTWYNGTIGAATASLRG
ncbi:MAG: hypothetical protein M3O88_03505 [Actinomycetota bacterium]|nr:hypothetical protein [Actinomycetota bacterium]